jgi:NAD+ kinase
LRGDATIARGDALNEVVLHRGASLRMIEFALYLDGHFVYSQHSDGLVISTPTGSTAYALSGGGPILHPALDAIALVPMFPHTLTSRPIVVAGNSEMRIVLGDVRNHEASEQDEQKSAQPELSCDGQMHVSLQAGDVVCVKKKAEKLKLIHPLDHNYYETCRTKLGWGSRLV